MKIGRRSTAELAGMREDLENYSRSGSVAGKACPAVTKEICDTGSLAGDDASNPLVSSESSPSFSSLRRSRFSTWYERTAGDSSACRRSCDLSDGDCSASCRSLGFEWVIACFINSQAVFTNSSRSRSVVKGAREVTTIFSPRSLLKVTFTKSSCRLIEVNRISIRISVHNYAATAIPNPPIRSTCIASFACEHPSSMGGYTHSSHRRHFGPEGLGVLPSQPDEGGSLALLGGTTRRSCALPLHQWHTEQNADNVGL